jgi:CTP:phosphocholine cytidylyltransferase-like protein
MEMNIQELNILRALSLSPFVSQRILAESLGYALGTVNQALRFLVSNGLLIRFGRNSEKLVLADKAKAFLQSQSPRNAIILAAGYGMRMVPINMESPKGLLKVKGETLIERTVQQLHEVGISEIHIVVGFMKEKFEYLMDKYNVDLIVNPKYAKYNNLESLACAAKYLKNTYVIPSDVWCWENPFNKVELYPWYMVSDLPDDDSNVRVNRKGELVLAKPGVKGNKMIGISYLCGEACEIVRNRIYKYHEDPTYSDKFWEETLYTGNKMIVFAKAVDSKHCVEINTYEQLS